LRILDNYKIYLVKWHLNNHFKKPIWKYTWWVFRIDGKIYCGQESKFFNTRSTLTFFTYNDGCNDYWTKRNKFKSLQNAIIAILIVLWKITKHQTPSPGWMKL
jgi:hypothetical protein